MTDQRCGGGFGKWGSLTCFVEAEGKFRRFRFPVSVWKGVGDGDVGGGDGHVGGGVSGDGDGDGGDGDVGE